MAVQHTCGRAECQSAFTPELFGSLQSNPAADQTVTESRLEDQSVQVRFLLPVYRFVEIVWLPWYLSGAHGDFPWSMTVERSHSCGVLGFLPALSAGSLGPSARKSGLQHNNTNNAYMQVFVGELLVMTESKNKHIRSSEVHKMFCQSSQRVSWISRHLSACKTSCVPPVRHLIVNKRNVRTRDDTIKYLVLSQPTYRVLQL